MDVTQLARLTPRADDAPPHEGRPPDAHDKAFSDAFDQTARQPDEKDMPPADAVSAPERREGKNPATRKKAQNDVESSDPQASRSDAEDLSAKVALLVPPIVMSGSFASMTSDPVTPELSAAQPGAVRPPPATLTAIDLEGESMTRPLLALPQIGEGETVDGAPNASGAVSPEKSGASQLLKAMDKSPLSKVPEITLATPQGLSDTNAHELPQAMKAGQGPIPPSTNTGLRDPLAPDLLGKEPAARLDPEAAQEQPS